jgi:hypothetical protein
MFERGASRELPELSKSCERVSTVFVARLVHTQCTALCVGVPETYRSRHAPTGTVSGSLM